MTEYFNLINRMREGVLVLSLDHLSGARQIEFFNKVVGKLFKSASIDEDKFMTGDHDVSIEDLGIARFLPSSLAKGNDLDDETQAKSKKESVGKGITP